MADTILSGDVTVTYLDEDRAKMLTYSGTTGLHTANALYSALMDHFDEIPRMDNPTPMSAQTPVEYTVGLIDAGDTEPWYISYELMEKVTSGAIRTAGWTRSTGTATGIVVIAVTSASNTFVGGDIGTTVTHSTNSDQGTLLEIIADGGATDYLVVRPLTNASAHDWNDSSGDVEDDNSARLATQSAAAVTGEQIWANLYSIGTIESDTHVYGYQGDIDDNTRTHVYSVNSTTADYWADGHIDICVPIHDYTDTAMPVIDDGYITVLARKGTTEYSSFEVATSTTSGGRNPVPLGTKADLNNTTGDRIVTLSGLSGSFAVGDVLTGDVSGAKIVLTDVDASPTMEYYIVADPQTDLNGSEAVTNTTQTGAATGSGATAANGPALSSWFTSNTAPTVVFGTQTFDTDDDGTDENYGIYIDCNANPLSEVYEWLKYATRRGESTLYCVQGASTGIEGEQYIGGEVYLDYGTSPVSGGTIVEGDDVTQETTGATGVVISHDTTAKIILLRNTRGSFSTGTGTDHTITSNDNSGAIEMETADSAVASAFAANVVSPYGSFAGGTFFGARGVLITDWLSADENAFFLTPIEGGTFSRPTAITLTVSNLVGTDETTTDDDRVAIFRLTGSGGEIDKTEYSSTGAAALYATSIVVDGSITQDTPGKTTGGVLRVRDESNNNQDYRIRFDSWTGSTFTLSSVTASNLTAGTNTTTIVSTTAELDGLKRGDIVVNQTQSDAVSYISSVDAGANTVTISPAIASQSSTDTIHFNVMPIDDDTLDDVYVPLLDTYASAGTASASIVYSTPIFFRVIARNSENATPIVPFTTDDTTSGTDRSNAVVRTEDTILV